MMYICPKNHQLVSHDARMRMTEDGTLIVSIPCEKCEKTYETHHLGITAPRLVVKEWPKPYETELRGKDKADVLADEAPPPEKKKKPEVDLFKDKK